MVGDASPAQAAIGFRVKSGWATAVLIAGSLKSPQVRDRRRIELSDPAVAGTIQPYHAGMGKLQTDEAKIEKLRKIIQRAANQSARQLVKEYRDRQFHLCAASLVVGSDIDPDRISNPHIRAHALEGRLFRTTLEDALKACGLPCSVIVERNAYHQAETILKRPVNDLKRTVTELGRHLPGPWRADEKTACLAAWLALT
ncbi:MAG TPA: hypothetical protein VGY66_11265 [Gemmataceae bacterium]|jgi:hypothetical protein|nr:hypothetical protein [Gemmataceae bacterium]